MHAPFRRSEEREESVAVRLLGGRISVVTMKLSF